MSGWSSLPGGRLSVEDEDNDDYDGGLAIKHGSGEWFGDEVESSGLFEGVRRGVAGYVCLSVEFLSAVDL